MQVTFILSAHKGLTKYTKSYKVRLFKALIVYILHTIVNTHGSKITHIAFASSHIMNRAGMRKGQEQQTLPAVTWAERGRWVRGGWCLPCSGQQVAVTGPGTRKEVLLPNMEAKRHCVNWSFTCSHLISFIPLQKLPLKALNSSSIFFFLKNLD